jgi:hypothetical protein
VAFPIRAKDNRKSKKNVQNEKYVICSLDIADVADVDMTGYRV